MILKLVNRALRSAGLELRRSRPGQGARKGIAATIRPSGQSIGNVLISYVPDDVTKAESEVSPSHTHYWECRHMAKSYAAAGFTVDVIDFADNSFVPQKDYDILVSARTNLERLAKHLGENCLKIAHLDTAHFLTHNANATQRLLEIRDRHRVSLRSNRMVEDNWAIEAADLGCVLGNEFTANSYAFAGKAIHRIPLSSVLQFDWQDDKSFAECRDTFIWFGSGGFAHKGLDLVLDAFAELPQLKLVVCGPIDQEPRFVRAFEERMYQTANIETIGWIDVTSRAFDDLRRRVVATIYPSCSEGGGGSVITCMHAGLIPIVTPEASVDVGATGIVLEQASVEAIRDAALSISGEPEQDLENRARQAWQRARDNHTREIFAQRYDEFVATVVMPEFHRRKG